MSRFTKRLLTFFIFSLSTTLFAQNLPNGYKNITLGLSLEDTKSALLKDPDFGYHGERDVSLLPNTNKTIIETENNPKYSGSFLTNCYFQFTEDKLFIITININQEKIDYYTIFTNLCTKYGFPNEVTPQASTWKNDDVTMSLEKPLCLKYIDNELFENAQTYSNVPQTAGEMTRQQFLDEL